MEVSQSTSEVMVDEKGLRHFRMNADTGHLGLTGMNLGEEIPEPIVPAELAEGTYSNLAYLRELGEEIVLDFARVNPSAERPTVKARIVMTRGAAFALMEMLQNKFKE